MSPPCGLPTHPGAHLPRPTSLCYTESYTNKASLCSLASTTLFLGKGSSLTALFVSRAQSLSVDTGAPPTPPAIPFCSSLPSSPSRARHRGCLSSAFTVSLKRLPQHLKKLKILPGQLYRYTVFGLRNCPFFRLLCHGKLLIFHTSVY